MIYYGLSQPIMPDGEPVELIITDAVDDLDASISFRKMWGRYDDEHVPNMWVYLDENQMASLVDKITVMLKS